VLGKVLQPTLQKHGDDKRVQLSQLFKF
jgi:hypothetical protein